MKLAIFCKEYSGKSEDELATPERVELAAGNQGFDVDILTFSAKKEKPNVRELSGVVDFAKAIRSDYDYLYVYNSYFPNNLAPLLSWKSSTRLIYDTHCLGVHELQPDWKNWIKRKITFPFMQNSYIRCLSEYEKEKYSGSGFDEAQLFYCPYGINYELFSDVSPAWDSLELFSIANFRPVKDVETQILAINNLVDEYPQLQLNLIGSWSEGYRERIEKLIFEKDLEENVSFHGFMSHSEISEILKRCQLCIHSSKFETQGLSIYEASAAGFPICTSDRPVHNRNFTEFTHSWRDYEKLSADIKSILEMDKKKKEEISSSMRDLAKSFSYEREIEKLNQFFDKLITEGL